LRLRLILAFWCFGTDKETHGIEGIPLRKRYYSQVEFDHFAWRRAHSQTSEGSEPTALGERMVFFYSTDKDQVADKPM
jgi:hypothetical protein